MCTELDDTADHGSTLDGRDGRDVQFTGDQADGRPPVRRFGAVLNPPPRKGVRVRVPPRARSNWDIRNIGRFCESSWLKSPRKAHGRASAGRRRGTGRHAGTSAPASGPTSSGPGYLTLVRCLTRCVWRITSRRSIRVRSSATQVPGKSVGTVRSYTEAARRGAHACAPRRA
jgi:hypothetical protein